jgi:putative membrane protein insertion efficiency factor
MRLLAVALIRLYQVVLSPLFPPACRFHPTCSQYALVAITEHGLARGGWLALKRLARCNPWHPGGVDFVPKPIG